MTSFRLPASNSKASALMGDMATVAEVLHPANIGKLPLFPDAVRQARRAMEASNGQIRSIAYICLRADDERWLISVGPRGGWQKVWNFGTGRAA